MKIAYDFSYDVFVSHREGICVYNSFVFQSLLENYPDVSIDIFMNEINIPELKTGMKTYFDRFQNRIRFITRQQRILKWYEIPWNKYLFYTLKQNFYSLLSVVLKKKKEKYKQKRGTARDKKKNLLIKIKSLSNLASESNADVVFGDFVSLKLSHCFKCPKVFMLHDLFTIPLADLFREAIPNIDKLNQNAVENLQQYANEGTYFITSGKYIRDEQLLKYVTNLTLDRTTIIPFPPMVRDFKPDQLISEDEFRDKFKINGAYIPYASQNRPNKNVILLLKALKRLKDKRIQISVVTTGDFRNIKKCADFIDQNNLESNIRQIGTVSENELYALYKYSAMVVVPTIIEGLGMSGQCLEALSFKTIPVIHAKSWGIEESLEAVGLSMETADLNWIDLDDDIGLADKIEEVLSNPEPHIEKQKHIIEAYTKRTWADVAHDYRAVFEKAVREDKKMLKKYIFGIPFSYEKQKGDKIIKTFFFNLLKKVKSVRYTKYYFCGIRVFKRSKNPFALLKDQIDVSLQKTEMSMCSRIAAVLDTKLILPNENKEDGPHFERKSFAQSGEDLTIEMLFHYLFGKDISNIRYLDIGANDPVVGSNTYLFYRSGAKGVLIEPNPHFIPLYQEVRPNDKAVHAGINFGTDKNSADYYDFGKIAHGLNTFSAERKDDVIKTYPLQKVHHIPFVDINDVLSSMDGVDFISLDVEGLELEILKTLDFNNEKFRPKMFCIEANKRDITCGYESELVRFMKEKDYVVVADNFINLIFADIRQIRHLMPYELFCGNIVLKNNEMKA